MLILASKSEARQCLLANAGLAFIAHSPDVDENSLKSENQNSTALAQTLATAKSLSLGHKYPNAFIIGADQTLCIDQHHLSKPQTLDVARAQLQQLRGKCHTLTSALTVSYNGQVLFQHSDTATLNMRNFSDGFLEYYLANASPAILHSVGSYHIEDIGINLFSKVDGDLYTIQGLPLLPLLAFLREVGELPT